MGLPDFPYGGGGGDMSRHGGDGGGWPGLYPGGGDMSRHSGDGGGWPGSNQDHFDQVPPHRRSHNSETSYGYMPPPTPRMNPPTNPKGTTHIFFKTRLCTKFLEGTCNNGPNCTFAHGEDDRRNPPPNWQELMRDGGTKIWNDDQRLINRMKICRRFYNGEECPYGHSCNFLHERPSPNQSFAVNPYQRESAAISIGTQMMDDAKDPSSDVNNNVYWKTKLCSKWEITGECPFGERCHFAHGHSELHAPSVPVKGDYQVKPFADPAHVIDPSSAIHTGAQTERINKFSKWKPSKKINKIYGDWLDDDASPNEEDW